MGIFDKFFGKKEQTRKDYTEYEVPRAEEIISQEEEITEEKANKQKEEENKQATNTKSDLDLWNYLKDEEKYVKNKYQSVTDINNKIDTIKVNRLNNITDKTRIDHHNKLGVYKEILKDKMDIHDEKLMKDVVLNADKIIKHRMVGKAEFVGQDGTLIGSVTLKGFLPENKNIVDEHWVGQTIGSDNFNDFLNNFKGKKGTTIQHVTGYKNHVGRPSKIANISYSFSFA